MPTVLYLPPGLQLYNRDSHTQTCDFFKKETLAQVFFCEFCEFLTTPFYRHHLCWLRLSGVRFSFVLEERNLFHWPSSYLSSRSSPSQVLYTKGVLKKHQQHLLLIKLQVCWLQVCERDSSTAIFLGIFAKFYIVPFYKVALADCF